MDFASLIYFLPSLLIGMSVHEMCHALVSNALGDPTAKLEGRVSLNPFVHIDPILTVAVPAVMLLLGMPPIMAAKPVPFRPDMVKYDEFGAALIAIAGPLSNLALAVIASFVLRGLPVSGLLHDFIGLFVVINISMFIFNLVPWPPLDGSRVLYALAPEPIQRVMRQIESFGMTGLIIFVVVMMPVLSPIIGHLSDRLLAGLGVM